MAYNALNNLIDAYIYANGVQAITGQILNGVLKQMVSQLGSGYHLMGVASPQSVPASEDYAMAYFAASAGEYSHFGGITIAVGEVAVLLTYGNGSWSKRTIYNVPTGTADLENTAGFITNAVTDLVNYYTKDEIDATFENYPTLSDVSAALDGYYDKAEVNSIIATLSRQEYIVAWNGLSAPDVTTIPVGVTVTYSGTTYTGTLAASASTVNKIYMVWNGTAYDMYGTSQDGGYSWVPMGTTTVDLSQYATKDEVIELDNIKLLFDSGIEGAYIALDGEQIPWAYGYISNYIKVTSGTNVKVYTAADPDALVIAFYDENGTFVNSGKIAGTGASSMVLYESVAPIDGFVRFYTSNSSIPTAWADSYILIASDTVHQLELDERLSTIKRDVSALENEVGITELSSIAPTRNGTLPNGGNEYAVVWIDIPCDGYDAIKFRVSKPVKNEGDIYVFNYTLPDGTNRDAIDEDIANGFYQDGDNFLSLDTRGLASISIAVYETSLPSSYPDTFSPVRVANFIGGQGLEYYLVLPKGRTSKTIEDLDSRIQDNYFVGNGNTWADSTKLFLRPGGKYRLYPFATNWDMTGVTITGAYKLEAYSMSNGVSTQLAFCAIGVPTEPFYDITVPSDSEYMIVGGRASAGTMVRFSFTESSGDVSKQDLIANAFSGPYNETDTHNKSHEFSAMLNGGVCETFAFMTDPHLLGGSGSMNENIFKQYIGTLIKYYNETPVDWMICGGDWLNAGDTQAEACWKLGYMDATIRKLFKHYFPVLGNHDTNYQGVVSSDDPNRGDLTHQAIVNLMFRENGNTYYKFKGNNTQFYVFDTGIDWETAMNTFKWEQINWFANALIEDDAAHTVIIQHIFYTSERNINPMATNIQAIAGAYNSRSSVTLNGITYNFAGCTGKIACVVAGHSHEDIIVTAGVSVPVWLTTNMTDGSTPTFDLCVIDYTAGKMKSVRVGTGTNREMNLA